jgi:hypothetical protein
MLQPAERLTEKSWIAPWLAYEHASRYEWAAQMAAGLTVVDAACGTGYGCGSC